VMHDLGTLGGDYSEATLINDANVIAGDAATTTASASGNIYPFVFANGTMLKIFSNLDGSLDDTEMVNIVAINNSGQIAGNGLPYPVGFGGETGFFFSQGTYTYLGNIVPAGLNNAGQMVGTVFDFSGAAVPAAGASQYGPFIYSGGVLTFLDTLIDLSTTDFSFLVSANAISDSGYIVGTGVTTGGQTHAFLLTPIPPPSS
jgi:probable HAF family extracellular repeat protein